MKILRIFVIGAVAAAALSAQGLQAAQKNVSAVVTYTKGKAQVMPAGAGTWSDMRMGQFIYEGDTVRTGPGSRAGITYTGGIENRLNANTTLKVEPAELANRGEGNKVQMLIGKVWTKILRKGTKFHIHTPVAVCSVRGTEYETDVGQNGRTDVKVYEGEVELSNQYGTRTLNKNSKCSVEAGSPPSDPVPISGGEKDNWQDEMDTKGSLKISVEVAALEPGKPAKGVVKVLDKKGSKDGKYAGKITITSDSPGMAFAPGVSDSWGSKLESEPADGELAFSVKALNGGFAAANITASAEGLGVSMIKIDIKRPPVKNLKVKIKTADGNDKELLLKFKSR